MYAKVASASRDMEPTLTCVDAAGRAGGLGHLKEGTVLTVSTGYARKLLGTPPAPVLEALGASLQFELASGMNGRAWVQAPDIKATILVSNILQRAEKLSDDMAVKLVEVMVARS